MKSPSLLRVCGMALACVALAASVRTLFYVVFNESIPYTPFYPAIVAATIYGRLRGGLIALGLASIAATLRLEPYGTPLMVESTDLVGLLLFFAVSVLVVVLCERMRLAQERAEAAVAEQQRLLKCEHAARRAAEDANRLKDEFLACVSHELRTPLQAILGWNQLLQSSKLDEQTISHGLAVIERNARVQAHLIEDLLDISRIVAGRMRLALSVVNPKQVIDAAIQTVSTAAAAKQIRIVREFDDDVQHLTVDPDRMQQIVWNLLSNAIKFSPDGGTVTVRLRREPIGDRVLLEVQDQGCGIAPELAPHVFERFRQAHEGKHRHGGLGLGLAIVKCLVELHGGTVEAHSAGLNCGTTMIVKLPGTLARLSSDGPKLHSTGLQGVRVLVVDDDPETREVVGRILEDQHAEVVLASGAAEALEALQHGEPDVIVSDIAMPEQDGYEFLRRVRRRPGASRIPAMALTARTTLEDRHRTFKAGYKLHLSKPVEAKTLTDAVAELASVASTDKR